MEPVGSKADAMAAVREPRPSRVKMLLMRRYTVFSLKAIGTYGVPGKCRAGVKGRNAGPGAIYAGSVAASSAARMSPVHRPGTSGVGRSAVECQSD